MTEAGSGRDSMGVTAPAVWKKEEGFGQSWAVTLPAIFRASVVVTQPAFLIPLNTWVPITGSFIPDGRESGGFPLLWLLVDKPFPSEPQPHIPRPLKSPGFYTRKLRKLQSLSYRQFSIPYESSFILEYYRLLASVSQSRNPPVHTCTVFPAL